MRSKLSHKGTLLLAVIIHIVLSFVWERIVFRNVGINPSSTKVISYVISDKGEIALTYILTHLFAALMIYLLWRLLFYVFSDFKKEYIVWVTIFLLGAVAIFVLWPEVLTGLAGYDDNLVTYSCAVRLTPDYWHGVYSSIIYAAILLVCPFNFFITLFQWGFFVYVLAYIFVRLNRVKSGAGYLVLPVFLLPSVLYVASNGHRMFHFTILAIWYTAVIAMDLYTQKERTFFEYAKVAFLGAFLSVFRSEGIIIGVLFFGIYALFGPDAGFRKVIGRIAVFAVIFVLLYLPGTIGSKKYYGKDYSLMNTFDVLCYILNSYDCNLFYEGADEDTAAISAVVPIDVIRFGGAESYRRYNYNIKGNSDINQSYTSAAEGSAYMSAYRSIVKNNLKPFVRAQVNTVMSAFGLGAVYPMGNYKGEPVSLDGWHYIGWDNGIEDFYADRFTKNWYENATRRKIAVYVLNFRERYLSFAKNRKLYILSAGLLVLTGISLTVRGVCAFFKKKDRIRLSIGFMWLACIIGFGAVCAVMPTYSSIYFISSIYCLLTLLCLTVCNEWNMRTKKQ